jgi:nitronate monooxygenase
MCESDPETAEVNSMTTALTSMFGLKYPVIQAPMANASGGDLAREVARAGGLGMVGTGTNATADWLRQEWQKIGDAGPVGAGFMLWALNRYPEQRELLHTCLELRPAAILLSFGDPRRYMEAIRAAGARVIIQVQTVADALLAEAAGADLIVAQGTEAGGHTGQIGTLPLLAAVLRATGGVPVAAAGGIGDGRGVAGVIAMGACGAMLGTRFVATPESLYHQRAKERILLATESDTVLTRVFDLVQGFPWPEQYPGRALTNGFTGRWHGHEAALAQNLAEARKGYQAARQAADYDQMAVYAGQVAGQIRDIVPAAELVRRIGEEAATLV